MPFTLNNYTADDIIKIKNWPYTYLVYGLEIGEECGTPHVQGYVEFKSSMKLTTIQNLFNKRMHVAKRRGTPKDAAEYCKKSDPNYFEDGKMSNQGKRTDIDNILDAVLDGATDQDLLADVELRSTFFKYNRHVDKVRRTIVAVQPREGEAPWASWFYGGPGTGKTYSIFEEHGVKNVYIKDGTKWWDGYIGQEAIVLDDFDPSDWKPDVLLRLLDGWPFQGEHKGGWTEINSPFIYFTCPSAPELVFHDNARGGSNGQFLRRLDDVREFKQKMTHLAKPKVRPIPKSKI